MIDLKFVTQAELRRMAAVAKAEGVTIEVECNGVKVRVSRITSEFSQTSCGKTTEKRQT